MQHANMNLFLLLFKQLFCKFCMLKFENFLYSTSTEFQSLKLVRKWKIVEFIFFYFVFNSMKTQFRLSCSINVLW